jgi:hypothetical protein
MYTLLWETLRKVLMGCFNEQFIVGNLTKCAHGRVQCTLYCGKPYEKCSWESSMYTLL